MNKIKDGMQNEISQKLTLADSMLRENIGKMVKSKPVIDAIGQSAGQAIANEAHAAYKQAFQQVVVPSFESASRNLFTQMNEIFRKGTSECKNCVKFFCRFFIILINFFVCRFGTITTSIVVGSRE